MYLNIRRHREEVLALVELPGIADQTERPAVLMASLANLSGAADWECDCSRPMLPERSMARYYFHMQTETRTTDEGGSEFDTPAEARAAAIRTCGQMMKDSADGFWGTRPWSVIVTDAVGLILWEKSMDGYAAPGSGCA